MLFVKNTKKKLAVKMNLTYKTIKNLIFIVVIPFIIGFLISKFVHTSPYIIAGILFCILFIFSLPSDSIGRGLDYNTKSINPNYRPENPKFDSGTIQEIITIIVIVLSIVLCIFLYQLEQK